MRLIADAVRLRSTGDQLLDDLKVLLLLTPGAEDLVFIDPKRMPGELARLAKHLRIEVVSQHGVDGAFRFPTSGMIQCIPLGDVIFHCGNDVAHVGQHLFLNGLRLVFQQAGPVFKRTPAQVVTAHTEVTLVEPCERLVEPYLAEASCGLRIFSRLPGIGLHVVFKNDSAEAIVHDGPVALAVR